ncbi:MAG TPA: hypothetical protein VKA21_16465 [Candidatus Binatia bacterium]|nr:hypothetical protein [Candidatus Binatia bacterium]
MSAPLQKTPSLHAAPSAANWPTQRPTLSQWSPVVHWLPSKQSAPCPTN